MKIRTSAGRCRATVRAAWSGLPAARASGNCRSRRCRRARAAGCSDPPSVERCETKRRKDPSWRSTGGRCLFPVVIIVAAILAVKLAPNMTCGTRAARTPQLPTAGPRAGAETAAPAERLVDAAWAPHWSNGKNWYPSATLSDRATGARPKMGKRFGIRRPRAGRRAPVRGVADVRLSGGLAPDRGKMASRTGPLSALMRPRRGFRLTHTLQSVSAKVE